MRSPARTAASAAGASVTTGAPIVTAMVSATSAGSATPARSTNQTRWTTDEQVGRAAHGEPRLADAAHAGQGHEREPVERLEDAHDVDVTPDERRPRRGQVARRRRGARRDGEAGGQLRVLELPQPLGLREVAEVMGAEVGEVEGRRPVAHERGGDVGQHDLAAVPRGHDPGGPVEGSAAEVVADALDLPGVHPHADGDADGGHPQLRRHGGLHGGVHRREAGGDAVAHRGEDLAARRADRLAEHLEVGLDASRHAGRLLPLAGGTDDVGEQQAHRGARRPGDRTGGPGRGCAARQGARLLLSSHRRGGLGGRAERVGRLPGIRSPPLGLYSDQYLSSSNCRLRPAPGGTARRDERAITAPAEHDGRRERSRRTRAQIVAAAARRFVADGYAGTTMEGVAADAGVAVQTVYYAFGTKAKLLAAVLDATIAGDTGPVAVIERDWVAALAGEKDLDAAVGSLVAEGIAIVARTAPVLDVVGGAASIPEVGELLVETRGRRRQDQRRLVDVLVTAGLVPAAAPRDVLADIIYALLNEDVFLLLDEGLRVDGRARPGLGDVDAARSPARGGWPAPERVMPDRYGAGRGGMRDRSRPGVRRFGALRAGLRPRLRPGCRGPRVPLGVGAGAHRVLPAVRLGLPVSARARLDRVAAAAGRCPTRAVRSVAHLPGAGAAHEHPARRHGRRPPAAAPPAAVGAGGQHARPLQRRALRARRRGRLARRGVRRPRRALPRAREHRRRAPRRAAGDLGIRRQLVPWPARRLQRRGELPEAAAGAGPTDPHRRRERCRAPARRPVR